MQRTGLDWRWPMGVAAGCLAALAEAAPGDLDTNYGVGGRAVPASSAEQVGMLLPIAGDRLVYSVQTADGVELRRLDSRGSPDATFGVAGRVGLPGVSDPAHAGAVAPDGKLLFASYVQRTVDGALRYLPAVVRVDASGHPDSGFGPDRNGIATLSALPSFDESIVAMATYPDGRIALMGFDGNFEGSCGEVIVRRLRVDGSEDTAFGSGGVVRLRNEQNCEPPSLGPRSDGSLLVLFGSSAWRLTASGALDPGFETAGTASTGGEGPFRSVVLADGRYLAASRHDPTGRGTSASIRLARFLGSGQADPGFGSGTGSVVIAAGNALTGRSDLEEQVLDLAVSRDERQIYLLVDIRSADSTPRSPRYACRSVVRLSAAGVLDPAYGHNGVACLVRGADLGGSFETVLPREDGSVLVDSRYAPVTDLRRLLGDATPSAGIISVQSDFAVVESAARMTVTIGRSAGVDGAVSVEYSTGDFAGMIISPLNLASSGLDYRPASGRLDWASGDSTDRTLTIDLIDDRLEELPEYFVLRLANPGGGAIIIDATRLLQIDDNDARAVVAPAATTPVDNGSGSGGGGSIGWMTLAMLAAALRVARADARSPCRNSRIRPRAVTTAIPVLALLAALSGAEPAAAKTGDIDLSFGIDGRGQLSLDGEAAYHPVLIAPDGGLLVGWRTYYLDYDGEGAIYRLRSDGRLDPAWGNAGPGRARFVDPTGDLLAEAVLLPDGRLAVGGAWGTYRSDGRATYEPALALLRADGSAEPGFGVGGVVRWRSDSGEDRVRQLAVTPDGRVVAAFDFSSYSTRCVATLRLKRFLGDGSEDPAFRQPAGSPLKFDDEDCERATTLQPLTDGRLLVAASGRVYRIRADGSEDPAALPPRLDDSTPPWSLSAARASGELLLAGTSGDRRYASADGGLDLVLTRLRADGTRDTTFGTRGDGVVALDLGRLATGLAGVDETLDAVTITADGQSTYVAVRLQSGAGASLTGLGEALLRLTRDGRPDLRFGTGGIVRLARHAGRRVIALGEQPSHALLVAYGDGAMLRLLADERTSDGMVQLESGTLVTEGPGARATLVVSRVGGSDGPLAVDWSTFEVSAGAATARIAGDFVAASGHLEWPAGDSSDRRIDITIVDDSDAEFGEAFEVLLSGATSGTKVLRGAAFVSIVDDDRAATTPVTPATTPASTPPAAAATPVQGGGGAASMAWLMSVLALALARQPWRRCHRPACATRDRPTSLTRSGSGR